MRSPLPDSPTPVGMYSKGISRDTPSTVASTPTPLPPARSSSRPGWDEATKKTIFTEEGASQKPGARPPARSFKRSQTPGGNQLDEITKKANPDPTSHLGRVGRNRSNSRRKKSAGKDKQKEDRLPAAPPIVREANSGKSVNLSMTGGSREGTYELKRDRSGRARSDTLTPQTPPRPYRGLEFERVRRCTREAVWNACDVFWQFDVNWSGEITRKNYIDGLADPPTIEKLRTLRRAQVEQRFRSSARPITLKDWIVMLWPKVTPRELDAMMRWVELREAYSIVHHKKFRCHETEMNRVYFLLDVEPINRANRDDSKEELPRGSGDIPLGELVRARLLTTEEVFKLFRDKKDLHETIGKETFKSQAHPHFKNNYVTADTKSRMKQEEEALQITSSLNTAFSTNLFGSQTPAS